MSHYTNKKRLHCKDCLQGTLSTRKQRRNALVVLIDVLVSIKLAEESYRDNIPLNLQNSIRFEDADIYIDSLDEAIDTLKSIY